MRWGTNAMQVTTHRIARYLQLPGNLLDAHALAGQYFNLHKRIPRLDRLQLRRLKGAREEFLLAATAQNLRRMADGVRPRPAGAVSVCRRRKRHAVRCCGYPLEPGAKRGMDGSAIQSGHHHLIESRLNRACRGNVSDIALITRFFAAFEALWGRDGLCFRLRALSSKPNQVTDRSELQVGEPTDSGNQISEVPIPWK